ncbi:AAA family ATPase [Limisalsivibrio acetivorans]|uniref:AAA family ATPase n=1 Tax=Limisalsivibrio acetivorans TaxID=1304888 RepID=UPI0003B39575|nr:AAA family ATPase [Limisalsivibrio acetivorans]
MYREYFAFRDKPFRLTPSPAYFYCSSTHDRAMTLLEYGINSRKGFMMLTGIPGSGKTTMCMLLRETLAECNTALVEKCPDKDILKTACSEFGIEIESSSEDNHLFGVLMDFFVDEYKKGKNNVLIIDDADEYSVETFNMLERLAEIEIEQCKLVQVLLVGTPELSSKLMYGQINNLNERVFFVQELGLLGLKDTAMYLQHRINQAKGADPDILKRTAVVEIHRFSHGLPLEVNVIADKAFQVAAEAKDKKVGPKHVRKAVKLISGVKPPLRFATIAPYVTPVLLVLVLILGFMQYQNMTKEPEQKVVVIEKAPEPQQPVTERIPSEAEIREQTTEEPEPQVQQEAEKKPEQVSEPVEQKPDQATEPAQPSAETEPAMQADTPIADNMTTQADEPESSVEKPAEEPLEEQAEAVRYGCITANSGLNMRAEPTTNGELLTVVPSGESAVLIENKPAGWWRAEYNGIEGYLYGSFVEETDNPENCGG